MGNSIKMSLISWVSKSTLKCFYVVNIYRRLGFISRHVTSQNTSRFRKRHRTGQKNITIQTFILLTSKSIQDCILPTIIVLKSIIQYFAEKCAPNIMKLRHNNIVRCNDFIDCCCKINLLHYHYYILLNATYLWKYGMKIIHIECKIK